MFFIVILAIIFQLKNRSNCYHNNNTDTLKKDLRPKNSPSVEGTYIIKAICGYNLC